MPSPRGPLLAATTGASIAALIAGTALADPAPPFDQLLKSAETTAPRLAESRADVGQSQGLARQAAVRPNPTLSLGVENIAGSGPFAGFDTAEATLQVEQALELGGKRPARMASGRADLDAARARAAQSRADFAFDLAAAYAAAEATHLRLQLATDAIALAREDERVATALVSAGKEADLRGMQARSAVQSARAALQSAQADRTAAFARLTALAGAAAPITSIAAGLLDHADRMETPRPPDVLKTPAYLAARAEREAVFRRVRLEQARATPDLSVLVGVRRLAGDDATALVVGLSAPLPVFDRNAGNISAAQAALRGADARLDAARLDAEAEIASALSRALAAQGRVAALREAEFTAGEAYRLTRLGYESGKLALLELTDARRILIEARAQTLDARLERLGAEAALARLSGAVPFGDHP